jgi:hypothetical protein
MSDDPRFVRGPYGRERTQDWLQRQLRRAEPVRSPQDREWRQIVEAYRRCVDPRPKEIDVAQEMGFSTEQPLRDRLRPRGITRWPQIHAIIAAEPE